METIKVKVYVGKKEAILAGNDVFGEIEVEIKPSKLTQKQREELAIVCSSSSGVPMLSPNVYIHYDKESEGMHGNYLELDKIETEIKTDVSEETVVEMLNKRANLRKKLLAKIQPDVDKVITVYKEEKDEDVFYKKIKHIEYNDVDLPENLTYLETKTKEELGLHYHLEYLQKYICDYGEKKIADIVKNKMEIIKKNNTEINKFASEEEVRARKEKFKAEKEKEKAKKNKLERCKHDFLSKYGTDTQLERLEAGILPEKELRQALSDHFYAPLKDLPRYLKIKNSDFCLCDWDNDNIEYSVFPAKDVNEENYEFYLKIKKIMKDCKDTEIEMLEHFGICSTCDQECLRFSVKVSIRVCGLNLTKEYSPS